MTESDEDALWRSIVENYGERASLDVSDASSPPLSRPTGDDPGDPGPAHPPGGPINDPPSHDRRHRDRRHDVPPDPPVDGPCDGPDLLDAYDDPDDHFVPPDPPPVPAPEPRRLLAWAGVLGVPVGMLLLVVLRVSLPSWGSLLTLCWFIGGFGYLVATMRRDPDPDDWDDGARL